MILEVIRLNSFLYYCDVKDATIQYSQVGNYNHPDHPGLEDFGDAILLGDDNGTTEHFELTGLHRRLINMGRWSELLFWEQRGILNFVNM